MLFAAPTGYIITYNATEYEFDVNVYSPVGTVVFEALLIAENINNFFTISVTFDGDESQYGPFSINGASQVRFDIPISTNPLLMITLDEHLNSTDQQLDYEFLLRYFALHEEEVVNTVNVILHEVGKLLYIANHNYYVNEVAWNYVRHLLMCQWPRRIRGHKKCVILRDQSSSQFQLLITQKPIHQIILLPSYCMHHS